MGFAWKWPSVQRPHRKPSPPWRMGTPSNAMFSWVSGLSAPNRTSIRSAVFSQPAPMTDSQTDRHLGHRSHLMPAIQYGLGKTVRSLDNACHTWTLLCWGCLIKRRYIKCPFALLLSFPDISSYKGDYFLHLPQNRGIFLPRFNSHLYCDAINVTGYALLHALCSDIANTCTEPATHSPHM